MRMFKNLLAGCVLLFASNTSAATILTVVPSVNDASPGDSVTVDLVISGLVDGGADSLGAFFTEILFDESIVDFDNVLYSEFLGSVDPFAFETEVFTTTGAGFVTLDVFSFLFDFELDTIQPESFTIATLTFIVLSEGTTALDIGYVDFSTADGNFLTLDIVNASVTASFPIAVPEPNILAMLSVGLSLALWRKNKIQSIQEISKSECRV
jgi:hypothetical protein